RRLGEEVERWLRRREPLAYMLVDIDHFKRVNDSYGHQVGDQVLQQVAELLARFGGEEFMLLLPNTTRAQATAIAERLCRNVERHPFVASGVQNLTVTVSIGVACLENEPADLPAPGARLFKQADAALYAAKQAGRNRVTVAPS